VTRAIGHADTVVRGLRPASYLRARHAVALKPGSTSGAHLDADALPKRPDQRAELPAARPPGKCNASPIRPAELRVLWDGFAAAILMLGFCAVAMLSVGVVFLPSTIAAATLAVRR
jgi:hypothetical protein